MLLWPSVAVVVVTLSFTAGRLTGSFRPLPTIAATLTGTETGFSSEIDERIRKLFPVGSEEARLIDYLAAEGFAPGWQRTGDAKAARFIRQGLLCDKSVRVVWRCDDKGTLADVGGSYASHCF